MENKPTFVSRNGMLSDAKYVEWLPDVKRRFGQSQIKASIIRQHADELGIGEFTEKRRELIKNSQHVETNRIGNEIVYQRRQYRAGDMQQAVAAGVWLAAH